MKITLGRIRTVILLLVLVNFLVFACRLGGSSTGATPTLSGVLPPATGVLNQLSCLTGTWRVDTASYVNWMNKVNQAPTVKYTTVDPPFHYIFNSDGTFAIHEENIGLYFDAVDPQTGKSVGTFETISTGVVTGTIAGLDADPAYPGDSLITFNIMGNSVKMIDIKYNGVSISGTPPNNTPLIDPAFFAKVAYTCTDATLSLSPRAAGLPADGFSFSRDDAWKP